MEPPSPMTPTRPEPRGARLRARRGCGALSSLPMDGCPLLAPGLRVHSRSSRWTGPGIARGSRRSASSRSTSIPTPGNTTGSTTPRSPSTPCWRRADLRPAMDDLPYRARRILPSALAWLMSGGNPLLDLRRLLVAEHPALPLPSPASSEAPRGPGRAHVDRLKPG